MKRVFDIICSMVGLVVFLPVLCVASIAIRVKLGSPVFFTQIRPGLNGEPFKLIKFRTMSDKKGKDGLPLPDEKRMTKLGKLLRSTSIDELPELVNVLKGDMSIVGPRPLLMEYLPLYSKEQSRRHEVRPGITGWAQVNGRNNVDWQERLAMDVWYIDNRSFLLDLKIICLTVSQVLTRRGISENGHVTMSKFRGNEK